MHPAYIKASSCISHLAPEPFGFIPEKISIPERSYYFKATEPDYKELIPAIQLRRMSRIMKMGLYTGIHCINKAGIEQPDAIITGTGAGCFDDTDKFLQAISQNKEQLLNPTAFIQSTHNTIGGQLALALKCKGYNMCYTQQSLSFEFALQDAMLLFAERKAEYVLAGGFDELTPSLVELYARAGHLNNDRINPGKGYVPGEGTAFFVLSKNKEQHSMAVLKDALTFQGVNSAAGLQKQYFGLLAAHKINPDDISLVMSGKCGDKEQDAILNEFHSLQTTPVFEFKKLCGEHFSASAFACWLSANILDKQLIPAGLINDITNYTEMKICKHILIVNHYGAKDYSIILLSGIQTVFS